MPGCLPVGAADPGMVARLIGSVEGVRSPAIVLPWAIFARRTLRGFARRWGGAPMLLSTIFRGVAGYKVSHHATWQTAHRSGDVLMR